MELLVLTNDYKFIMIVNDDYIEKNLNIYKPFHMFLNYLNVATCFSSGATAQPRGAIAPTKFSICAY